MISEICKSCLIYLLDTELPSSSDLRLQFPILLQLMDRFTLNNVLLLLMCVIALLVLVLTTDRCFLCR